MAPSRSLCLTEPCLDPAISSGSITLPNADEHATSQRASSVLRTVLILFGMLLPGGLAQGALQAQTAYFSGAVTSLGGGFYYAFGVAVDQSGNIYVADGGNNAVKEIPFGCMSSSCVIGLGGGFRAPKGVALDASGSIYVADSLNFEVKEMPSGCASASCTVTLGGGFGEPFGVAVDKSGNVYIADTGNGEVKEMPPGCASSTCVTTLGGGGGFPTGVAVDESGNVYVADTNLDLYEMPPGCTLANFEAQLCGSTKLGGGIGAQGVTVDSNGNVYVANAFGSVVNEMPPGCTSASCVTTLGGGFGAPSGVAVDLNGNVYVGIQSNAAVQEIMPHGVNFGAVPVGSTGPTLTLYFTFTAGDSGITASVVTQGANGLDFVDAGTGTCDTKGTSYTYIAYPPGSSSVSYNCSVNVTFAPKYTGTRYGAVQLSDATGVIATAYIYGTGQGPQVAFDPGTISTIAGNGAYGFSGDSGVATTAELDVPLGVAVDSAGNVYIADSNNNRIREVNASTGIITTVAGNGTPGYSGDGGPAISAELFHPSGVAVDGAGNVYIADNENNRIREVNAITGIITTVAGGSPGYNGDRRAATTAELETPLGVAVDGAGNFYIADTNNRRIREVNASTGIITTVAGNGTGGFSGDGGPATNAELDYPNGVAVDGAGNVYIVDGIETDRIREVNASTGIITTVAGNGTSGFSGDGGAATSAELFNPNGVAVDGGGNIYISDLGNDRIREVNMSTGIITTVVGNGTHGFSGDGGPATSAELLNPRAMAVDGAGNVYVADGDNNRIREVNTSAASLSFASSNVGSQSADSPQSVTLQNIGNAPLTFLVPGTGENPSLSTNFTLDSATTCPEVLTSSSPGMLAGGATCALAVDFIPTTSGAISGTAVLTDNNLNVSSATQTIAISGTGTVTEDTTSTTVSVSPGTLMTGQTVAIIATVLDTTNSGTIPTGTVTFTDSLNGGSPVAMNGGNPVNLVSGNATLSGLVVAQGSHVIGATYGGVSGAFQGSNGNSSTVTVSPDLPAGASAPAATNFGTVPAASSSKQSVTFTFTAAGVIGAPVVVTQGATGLDFTDVADGTCNTQEATHVFNVNDTCTVDVTFAPKVPGLREGAVLLEDGSGNVLATANAYGVGSGPLVVYGTSSAIAIAPVVNGTSLSFPYGVVQDGSGNTFISDGGNNRVIKIAAGGGTTTAITPVANGLGLNVPLGMAVDGSGDLFIADFKNNRVVEVPAGGGAPIALATTVNGYPIGQISGVAVDGVGDLFITDTSNSRVVEVPNGGGGATVVYSSVQLQNPRQVAVDAAGDLFVGNQDLNSVVQIPAGGGAAITISPSVNGKGLSSPDGVAVDAAGDLFIADSGNNRVVEVPAGGGAPIAIEPTVNSLGLSHPFGVALDGAGDLFIADNGNNRVVEIQRSQLPTLNFASTDVGAASSDSPQAVTLQNIGNAPLSFSVPETGENPSFSTNFTLNSATTCPEVMTSSSPGSLAAGAMCSLAVNFIPTTSGPISGTAALTDNNLNVSSATQTINLSGTGLNSTISVSIGTSPAGLSFSINGTPFSTSQTPSLNIGTQYALSTTSPQPGGPGVQYVFSQWSDGTMGLTDLLTPTASTSSDTAQFAAQYMLTVTAGAGGTIAASTAPNGFYNPATLQPIAATPNAGYYFVGWTGANSPGDIGSATSASTSATMNGPENLTANFAPIPNLQVTTLNDNAAGNASNCSPPSSNCSLRDAITAIEANNGSTGNITFASGLNGTITLTSALPALSGQITITGPGAGNLTVSGGNTVQVFSINSGTVSISGLTIANGNGVNGGGITNNASLTVSNSAFIGNSASTYGGGIYSGYNNPLVVTGSTFSSNSAGTEGGGLYGGGATFLTLSNSTFFSNNAGYGGGGVYWCCYYATVSNTTISGNTARYGGGFFNNNGNLTINNSIVAGNTTTSQTGDDCDGCNTQGNYNLISTAATQITPMLSMLGNYGGPTQTMLPLPGSAAICGGSPALVPAGVTTDQRGFSDTVTYNGTQCHDLGAVQTNYALSFNASQEPPSTGTLPSVVMSPAPAITVTESGNPLTAGPASVSLTDTNSDLTTTPVTASTSGGNGQTAFSSLIFTGPTSGDTLTATMALNLNSNGLNLTATSTSFSVVAGTPSVIWPAASSITYGQMLGSSTLNGGSASFGNTAVLGSFAFTNPSTVPGAGTQTENITFTPTNPSAYNSVSGTVSVLVNKAMPTVTFTGAPASAPYKGTFSVVATANASTNATITVSGSCSIAGATVTITASSGSCSLTATWAADNNYLAGSATQSTIATKATPVITWATPAAITYGTALSATQLDATAINAGTTVAGTFAYTPAKGTVLGAGSQTLSVTFTPTNTTNFTSASASVILQVNKATPKITWAKPAAITYGTALSSTQLDATTSVPGTLVYSPSASTVLDAGTQTLSVSFTPTDTVDYTTATNSVTITVTKATAEITWPTPAPIVYGTALSSTQLDATASVPGTFVYSPAAGKIEPAGSNKLSVTFTPADTVDYGTVTTSVTLQVNAATPVINWPTPAAITFGTALTAAQLDATATNAGTTVAGTFAYTPAKGTVLGAGSQTLSVTFTPTNTTNFTSASASVILQVNKATPKITWAKPAAITYGTALSSTQLDATASVPGTLVYSPVLGAVLAGGPQTLSVTFNPSDPVDYTTAIDSVSITISQASSTTSIIANTPDPSTVGQPVSVSFSVSGANGVPTGTVTVTASTGQSCTGTLSEGTGTCALTLTATGLPKLTAVYSGDGNFKPSTSLKVTHTVQ